MIIRHRRLRSVVAALAALSPAPLRTFLLRRLLGHEIHREAVVGRAYIDVDHLRMERGASIGSLTIIRGCEKLEMGEEATIARLVYVNAVRKGGRYFEGLERTPAVILGRGALISSLHLIDASDTLRMGDFSELAGWGSQVLTHSLDFVRMRQTTQPVTVGHHCMIGTGAILLPGTAIADCSIVSAGSVMGPTSGQEAYRLYSGVPATPGRRLHHGIRYFHHTSGDIT